MVPSNSNEYDNINGDEDIGDVGGSSTSVEELIALLHDSADDDGIIPISAEDLSKLLKDGVSSKVATRCSPKERLRHQRERNCHAKCRRQCFIYTPRTPRFLHRAKCVLMAIRSLNPYLQRFGLPHRPPSPAFQSL